MFKPTLLMPRTSLPCHVQIYLYMFKLTLPRSNWLCHVQTYPATFKLTLPRSKLLCHVQTYPGTFKLVLVGFWLVKLSLLGFISVTKNVEKDIGICASPWYVSGEYLHCVLFDWNNNMVSASCLLKYFSAKTNIMVPNNTSIKVPLGCNKQHGSQ